MSFVDSFIFVGLMVWRQRWSHVDAALAKVGLMRTSRLSEAQSRVIEFGDAISATRKELWTALGRQP